MFNLKRMIFTIALLVLGIQKSIFADITFKNDSKDRSASLVVREVLSDNDARLQNAAFNPYQMIILEPGQEVAIAYNHKDYGLKNLEIVLIVQFVNSSPKTIVHSYQNRWEVVSNRSGLKTRNENSVDLSYISNLDLLHFPIKVQDESTYTIHNNENDLNELPYLTHSFCTQSSSNRRNFVAELNALLKRGQHYAIKEGKTVQVFIDLEKKLIELRSPVGQESSQGEPEYKVISEALEKPYLDIPHNLNFEKFIIDGNDEMSNFANLKTKTIWFFIHPTGESQKVEICLIDTIDRVYEVFDLILDPIAGRFNVNNNFKEQVSE